MSEKKTDGTSKITPLGDRVVIRALTEDEAGSASPSGIIIPDTVKGEKSGGEQGVVVAVGPGRWDEDGEKRIPMEVKVGDRVLFSSWRDKVKVDGDEYSVISEADVMAVITG